MMKKFLVLIDGPMGSGKTTTSKLINQKLPDSARIALPDIKRLVPNFRENMKTLAVVREVMRAMIEKYLENGVSVVLEQITSTDGVNTLKQIAETHNVDFYVFRLTAPKDIRLQRVYDRTKEMMAVSELPQSKIDELNGYFELNDQFYIDNPLKAVEIIDTQKLDLDQRTDMIISRLSA